MHPAHHTARVRRCGSTRAHGHSLSPLAADLAAGELLSCGGGGTFGKQLRPPSFPNIVVRIKIIHEPLESRYRAGRRRHVFAAAAARGGAGGL